MTWVQSLRPTWWGERNTSWKLSFDVHTYAVACSHSPPPPGHTDKYINKPITISNFNGKLGVLVHSCNSALRRLRQGWKLEASLIYKQEACLKNSQTRNKIGRPTNRHVGQRYCSPSMHEALGLIASSGLRKELTEGTNSLALKRMHASCLLPDLHTYLSGYLLLNISFHSIAWKHCTNGFNV